jgi:hypothetical protein
MRKEKKKNKKNVYQKPQLLRVKLVANESVLTGCKSSGNGPGTGACTCSWMTCSSS